MAKKGTAGPGRPASLKTKAKNYGPDHNAIWRRIQRAHERRAADFARRFAHRRGGP